MASNYKIQKKEEKKIAFVWDDRITAGGYKEKMQNIALYNVIYHDAYKLLLCITLITNIKFLCCNYNNRKFKREQYITKTINPRKVELNQRFRLFDKIKWKRSCYGYYIQKQRN